MSGNQKRQPQLLDGCGDFSGDAVGNGEGVDCAEAPWFVKSSAKDQSGTDGRDGRIVLWGSGERVASKSLPSTREVRLGNSSRDLKDVPLKPTTIFAHSKVTKGVWFEPQRLLKAQWKTTSYP